MTAFADLSELVNRLSGGNSGTPESIVWAKDGRVASAVAATPIIGMPISLWQYEGSPSHGAVPTTVAVPDEAMAGGMRQTDPGGGRQKWLTMMSAFGSVAGTLVLYDRLLHIGGLDGTSLAAQTVGGTLTRYTDGIGNIAFVEVYTQIGVTARTITMLYDADVATGQTSQAAVIGATNRREAQRIFPLNLAAGDKGVKVVTSVTLSASTGTAGNFGITVGHPLATITMGAAGFGSVRSFMDGPMPEILANACLAWYFIPVSTTVPTFGGQLVMAER